MQMATEEITPIADLQPYQRATVVGRLGARQLGALSTTVWLLEGDRGGLPILPGVQGEISRIRLDFRGPRPDLTPGKKVRVTGTALMLGRASLRIIQPRVETVPGPNRIVVFRSFACDTCRRKWDLPLWDWMGYRGEGFTVPADRPGTAVDCPDCEGTGFHRYGAPGWFALPWWAAVSGIAVALAMGWLLAGLIRAV